MNLHHLKYFYDTVLNQSYSAAARSNSVGQPAISKAIAALECELKVSLVKHKRNSFVLTDEGSNLFRECTRVFDAVDQLKDSLDRESPMTGEFRLGCQASIASSLLFQESIRILKQLHSSLTPNLWLGRTDLIEKWMEEGKIDFAIVINNKGFKNFEITSLTKGCFYLIKHKDYKENWKKDGVLMTENTGEVRQLKQKYQLAIGERLNTQMVISSWTVIKSFVKSRVAAGFLPDYIIQKELKEKSLLIVEKKNFSFPYEIVILTPKGRYVSKKISHIIQKFIETSSALGK